MFCDVGNTFDRVWNKGLAIIQTQTNTSTVAD